MGGGPTGGREIGGDWVSGILRDAVVEARVGLHAWERHAERPSRLVVTVEMAARSPAGRLDAAGAPFLDYDPVRAALRGWAGRGHTDLLETLAEELFAVCFANAAVAWCRVEILKPDVFNEAGGAGIAAARWRVSEVGA